MMKVRTTHERARRSAFTPDFAGYFAGRRKCATTIDAACAAVFDLRILSVGVDNAFVDASVAVIVSEVAAFADCAEMR